MTAAAIPESNLTVEQARAAAKGTPPKGTKVGQSGEPSEPPVVLIDASNVAYGKSSGASQAKIENLRLVLAGIERAGLSAVALADASLRHKIDAKSELEAMFSSGMIEQVPSGTSADDFLWQLWKRHRSKGYFAYIVTNDRFPTDRAREEGFFENPRVTYMILGGEVFFQPPIEQLASGPILGRSADAPPSSVEVTTLQPSINEVASGPNAPPEVKDVGAAAERTPPSIEKLVGAAMRIIASLTEEPGGGIRRINFAGVAHYLHAEHGGDFVARFGLRKPKELATLLSERGLVTITFVKATMYVEPTQAFDDQVKGLPRLIRAPAELPRFEEPVVPATASPETVPQNLRVAGSPETIDVPAGAPGPVVEIGDPETFLRLARDHHALQIFHWPCGVYRNEYESPFRGGGEFFFTSNGASFRLFGRAYRTVDDYLDARRRGFRGSDPKSVSGDRYGIEGVPALQRELEELVDPHRDGFVPQEGDVYYCARAAGFDDFATFLADRKLKSKKNTTFGYV
jgi:hypothetical protein